MSGLGTFQPRGIGFTMFLLKRIASAIDQLSRITGLLMAVLMPAMVLVLFIEVFSRYVFRHPTSWAQETSIFMFAAIGLIGGADTMRKKAHISVDLFYSLLSNRMKSVVDLVAAIVVLFFLSLVIYYGSAATLDAFEHALKRPMEPQLPLGPFLALIPLGAALVFLQTIANALRSLLLLIGGSESDA